MRANVQKMSPAEASRHARTIVNLYVELSASADRAEPLKVVPQTRPAPRYLTKRS